MWRITICLLLSFVTSACSTTPGDAARRGGHYQQAAHLYEAGAKQGNPLAAQELANLYNLSPGLPEDHKKAVYWYKNAIELGDIPSYWLIGVIYRDGNGNVPKDYGLAEQYFLKGAEKGHHYSIYALAGMYAEKLTNTSDDIEGLKWLNIVTAFATSCPRTNEGCQYILRDPKGVRETLESRMSPGQKQKAKELSDNWIRDWKQK